MGAGQEDAGCHRPSRTAPACDDVFCVLAPDGRFRRVSPALQRRLGVGRWRAALGRLAAGRDVARFVSRVIGADGAFRRLEWETRADPEQGVIHAVAGGGHDPDILHAIARQTTTVIGSAYTLLVRLDADGMATTVAVHDAPPAIYHRGQRQPVGNGVVGEVACTGRPAHATWRAGGFDGFIAERVRALGIVSAAAAPVEVDDRLWGVLVTFSQTHVLADDAERRLAAFAHLAGMAIAGADARRGLRRLAREQAALRRVATLVAREAPPERTFAAVAREVGEVLGAYAAHIGRFDSDGRVARVAEWTAVARLEDEAGIAPDAEAGTAGTAVGVPIEVEGRTWGVTIAFLPGPPAADVAARMQAFTDLLGTAIANADAHARVCALADEQVALSRVATLVARQAPQSEVFGAIAEEIGRLLAVDSVTMVRFEQDGCGVVVASAGPIAAALPTGTRERLGGRNLASMVFRTAAPARLADYDAEATGPLTERLTAAGIRSGVGTPITVEGRMWGAMLAMTHSAPLPADTEQRMGQFTELMATAIANAEARTELTRLVDEQAALRRVATRVARGGAPSGVFDAVTQEVADLLDASSVTLARYEGDHLMVVASRGRVSHVAVGERYPMGGANVTSTVLRTGRTARMDDYAVATGTIGDVARSVGVRSVVAAPVVVENGIWGVLAAVWSDRPPAPDDAAERLSSFAELLGTAIANADSRDQLTASRARVLLTADEARRRLARDLHDGAQQRLVHTVITLKLAHRRLAREPEAATPLVAEALETAQEAMTAVRELAHGILPAALTRGGLRPAIDALLSRLDLPVALDLPSTRLPREIEASVYFILAEGLTNVVKHARADRAVARAVIGDSALVVEVRDDGIGGADAQGQGLLGVADRVDALGGALRIESAVGCGTVLSAWLPLPTRPAG